MPQRTTQLPERKRSAALLRRGMRHAALLLLLFVHQAVAAPTVAVSIRPLQLIAAAITEGISEPGLVVAQGQDPHHLALRPSERRMLADAELVLWVGPMLEQPLAGVLGGLDVPVLAVQDMAGLELITIGDYPDPHVWLDTRNARVIGAALAQVLQQSDPANADRYAENLRTFHAALDQFDTAAMEQLNALAQQDWAVYHHAYRYLERQFGLRPPLTLADSENNAPGIRGILQLREQLQQKQLTCMLVEPGVNHDEIRTMLDLSQLRIVTADVIGLDTELARDGYLDLMQQMIAKLRECLQP
jgi:zinc transport system substrate-binding protein